MDITYEICHLCAKTLPGSRGDDPRSDHKDAVQSGERLPPEREIAEMLDVTRTVVREALIMLEIKGLVEVRRGAGIYVLDSSDSQNTDGPMPTFAMMRVLLSCYRRVSYWKVTSRNLPLCRLPAKISSKCVRHCNWKSVSLLPARRAAAKVVTCSSISPLPKRRITACWWSYSVSRQWRENNPMWIQLHSHLDDSLYRKEWLGDHKQILAALIKKMPERRSWQCGSIWKTLNNVCWNFRTLTIFILTAICLIHGRWIKSTPDLL